MLTLITPTWLHLELWRCDRQFDCKDGSDERACQYPASTTTENTPTTLAPFELSSVASNWSSEPQTTTLKTGEPSIAALTDHLDSSATDVEAIKQPQLDQLESNVNSDVSRIIQHESAPSLDQASRQTILVKTDDSSLNGDGKFDYDLILSQPSTLLPPARNESSAADGKQAKGQPLVTQIEFSSHLIPSLQTAQGDSPQAQTDPSLPSPPINRNQPQRIPMYRNLFKSLKNGNHQLIRRLPGGAQTGANPNQIRHVVAISRRRRERLAQPSSGQQVSLNVSSPDTTITTNPNGRPQSATGGVASYLQLLNSRYNNLRLTRTHKEPLQASMGVASMPAAAASWAELS